MADNLVNVASYEFLQQAEGAKLDLEAEGISAFVADATLVTTNWFLGNAVGYIKLQVPASQADRAKEVLARIAAEGDIHAGDEADRCLECGARMGVEQATCPACGWSYSDDDERSPSGEDAGEPPADDASGPALLGSLRRSRRPIMLLVGGPVFFVLAILAFLACGLVVELIAKAFK